MSLVCLWATGLRVFFSNVIFLQESCEELRKLAQKIESQLSEIIGSYAEAVVPCYESRGCETEGISKEVFHETPMKTSKQHEQKEREIDSQINQRAKKRRVRRLQDIGVLRKSPRLQKLIWIFWILKVCFGQQELL